MPPPGLMKTKSEAKGAPESSLASSRPAKRQRSGATTRRAAEWAASADAAALVATQRTHSNVASSQQQQDKTDSSEVLLVRAGKAQVGQSRLAAGTGTAIAKKAATKVAAAPPATIAEDDTAEVEPPKPEASPEAEAAPAERSPPAKRQRRIARAHIPPALSRELLRVTDRLSGPRYEDTDEGHYVFTIGDNLTPRFKIMRKFGEGTFGRVMECWDRRRSGYVAIKVIRAVAKYRDAAMVELQVLATLAANDTEEKYPIVRLLEWFEYRGHVCMVFDRLGPSIYDCLKRNSYRSFPLNMVQVFTRQILEAVSYMHSFSLIHTDLKPENILFLNDDSSTYDRPPGSRLATKLPSITSVRLIDFGSATFEEDYHSTIVSTRHYRAPEIMLGLGWSKPCDLWSLGCIVVELLTGDALFQTHENLEHLAMMECVVGTMPDSLIRSATEDGASSSVLELFNLRGRTKRLNWPEGAEGKRSLRAVAKLKPMHSYLESNTDPTVHPHLDLIVDLVTKLMAWDPLVRITAEEALAHPFFTADLSSS